MNIEIWIVNYDSWFMINDKWKINIGIWITNYEL